MDSNVKHSDNYLGSSTITPKLMDFFGTSHPYWVMHFILITTYLAIRVLLGTF